MGSRVVILCKLALSNVNVDLKHETSFVGHCAKSHASRDQNNEHRETYCRAEAMLEEAIPRPTKIPARIAKVGKKVLEPRTNIPAFDPTP